MKQTSRLRRMLLLVLALAVQVGCSTAPPANTNQRNANQPPVNANTPPANTSASKPAAQPDNSTTGMIEVTSVPPGARVLLIATDDDTASEPQPKGSTPTTITGVKPGNYTVDLEKPGYRFFQRSVKLSAGKTVKINATLKKQ